MMAEQKGGKQPEDSKFGKFRNFFRFGNKPGTLNVGDVHPQPQEFIFTKELLKDMSQSTPANHRLKTIRELSDVILTKRLEENAPEVIWMTIQDLIGLKASREERHLAFRFLHNLIRGQYDQLDTTRAIFFRVIKTHEVTEDTNQRLDILNALTAEGKDLQHFEEETGPFLLGWMKTVSSTPCVSPFLALVINIIKYNAAYLDESAVNGLVLHACTIALRTKREGEVILCLRLVDTVLCYTYLPSEALPNVTECLCKIVNVEKFAQDTWALMRKLLGTHLGHSGIYRMCNVLQDKRNGSESGLNLMRGAVFFIGMALWGSKKVQSLKHPPAAVLPYFKQALVNSNVNSIVAYEVVLSCQRLITKYGSEQKAIVWDLILDILELLFQHLEASSQPNAALISNIHDLLTTIESLHEQSCFHASVDRFFSIIELCTDKRPESSILVLVTHKAEAISPAHPHWIQNLNRLIELYFRKEVRTKVRLKVLDIVTDVIKNHFTLYEDDLMRDIVLPGFADIHADSDQEVKQQALELLLEITTKCQSNWCLDLLDIFSKVLNCQQKSHDTDRPNKSAAINIEDLKTTVFGLVLIFKSKVYSSQTSHVVIIHEMLINHFKLHYQLPSLLHLGGSIRIGILEFILDLRADIKNRLGLQNPKNQNEVEYSPYILCCQRSDIDRPAILPPGSRTSSPSATSPIPSPHITKAAAVSYAESFHCVRLCLEKDLDWTVLSLVLEKLPLVISNKSLISATYPEEFGFVCKRLCAMVSDRNLQLPEKLNNKPLTFTKSEFHAFIFPVLTSFVSYQTSLDKGKRQELIKCLEFGLVSKCSRTCIRALTVCLLEMKEVMMRQLPLVLQRLSQISATSAIAIPLMEFLSSLIHLSDLYSNFVVAQYMSIFAIALPYTNPFRYGHYTVSLAYHVLSLWFLKCRLPLRKSFVTFIVKGLRANVTQQFEETIPSWAQSNQDSAGRDRTQSLNEEAMRKKHQAAAASARARFSTGSPSQPSSSQTSVSAPSPVDETMMTFHKELVETCVDMMARYAFSTYSSMPKRSPVSDFLLKGGQSQSWLIGNNIITITTSGGSDVGASALCNRCLAVARRAHKKGVEAEEPVAQPTPGRQRHRSEAVKSVTERLIMEAASQDDLQLRRMSNGSESMSPLVTESGNHGEKNRVPLESRSDKINAVDDVLMGLQGSASSIFGSHLCNCWCTLWAEIHIRRPTGNLSWMMRIQNEQDLAEAFPDFSLADISSLFMSTGEIDERKKEGQRKIDSLHLQDDEYEGLLQQHFPEGKPLYKETIREHSTEECMEPIDDEAQMRKSNSSPELQVMRAAESNVEIPRDITTSQQIPTTGELKPPTLELKLPSNPELSNGRKRSGTVPAPSPETEKTRRTGVYDRAPIKLNKDSSTSHGGINPSFLFLQLFHSNKLGLGEERPLILPQNEVVDRSLKMLDLICPYETHKIGVVYVGPGQANDQTAILSNMHGSERYISLLEGLGSLVYLPDCIPENTYLGGLDTEGNDGKFAYLWHEEFIQVVFHVATLMPNKESDPKRNAKKLHIGNDLVTIVYNNSGEEHHIGCIKGQFDYVNVIVTPLDHGLNYVTVQIKPDVEEIIGHTDTKIISDANVGVLVRQMALHADLASTIMVKQASNPRDPYASNWLERLRQIKRVRSKVNQEASKEKQPLQKLSEDFTDFA